MKKKKLNKKEIIRVLVVSYPFCDKDKSPLLLLENAGFYVDNTVMELKRKLTTEELQEKIKDFDAVIAGTEKYDSKILSYAPNLKIISRLGIGLDSVDFKETRKRKIAVAYTPDAPSMAVAELVIGLIITLSRRVLITDNNIRNKKWTRIVGLDLSGKKIGIIGLGRIGKLVTKFLKPFNCEIMVNDISPDNDFIKKNKLMLLEKNEIYKKADVITLHIPKTNKTENLIDMKKLKMMKNNCILINTSRGGIVNEKDLYAHLKNSPDFFAGIDVFENEPYYGELCSLQNIILTPHLGSCSERSRYLMEFGAAKNIVDYFSCNKNENIIE